MVGKIYVVTRIITAVNGFGIFQHRGFSKPRVLCMIMFIVLGIAAVAGYSGLFGAEAPDLRAATATLFVLLPIGATLQVRRLRAGVPPTAVHLRT